MTRAWSVVKAYVLDAKWMQVLIPLVILSLYFISFSYFLSWLLPEYRYNVNAYFVTRAWKYLLLLAAGLYLVFLAFFKMAKGNEFSFGNTIQKPSFGDVFLILLPLTPVAQYIINNQDILSPMGSLYVLGVFAAFSLFFIIVAPALLGLVVSARTMMILGLAFTFSIANMASLSAGFHWLEQGSLIIQLALFGGVFLAGSLLYNLAGRRFTYFVVAVFFVANTSNQLVSKEPELIEPVSTAIDNKLENLVDSGKPLSTPNIYLLIYDAYVANETMLGYGIDNSAQEQYLETLGFELYPHTYSVAGFTIGTMGRTLNAATDLYGSFRKSVSGDGIVHNMLHSFGYATNGIFYGDFFFQGIDSSYDTSFPSLKATHKLLMKAVFMGEFRFDVEFDKPSREQFEKQKLRVFEKVPRRPRFIYMHDNLPGHSQNSGACRPNETALFEERLVQANHAMEQDVELILQKDPGAIIIVASDHGPYLTKNCIGTGDDYDISEISRHDIQDRFGTFLAIKWPAEKSSGYDDISVLQDLFPAIFAYLFEDKGLLDSKVESLTLRNEVISGATVKDGIINGGINDGEALFLNR
jgi:hypothetical protein